jgi:hypothetical protein
MANVKITSYVDAVQREQAEGITKAMLAAIEASDASLMSALGMVAANLDELRRRVEKLEGGVPKLNG